MVFFSLFFLLSQSYECWSKPESSSENYNKWNISLRWHLAGKKAGHFCFINTQTWSSSLGNTYFKFMCSDFIITCYPFRPTSRVFAYILIIDILSFLRTYQKYWSFNIPVNTIFLLSQTRKRHSSVFSTYKLTLTFPYLQRRQSEVVWYLPIYHSNDIWRGNPRWASKIKDQPNYLISCLGFMSWSSHTEKSKCAALWRTMQILGSKHAENKYAKNNHACVTK